MNKTILGAVALIGIAWAFSSSSDDNDVIIVNANASEPNPLDYDPDIEPAGQTTTQTFNNAPKSGLQKNL